MSAKRLCLALAFASMILAGLAAAPPALAQCVSLTTSGVAYNQNFDTLSSTAGSTTNNLTITGWFLTESGLGARDNEQYAVDTGGSNTGDMYSYGAAGNAERALGSLQSGTLIPSFGACFTNNTGVTIANLAVAYTGEEWRLGTAARTDQLDFEYSTDATSLTTGTWTAVNALDFVTPVTATAGAKDGNNAANQTNLSNTVGGLSIANGATFWIRWLDANASGADDGLAVDSFSLTPNGGPVLPTLNVGDATVTEGNAGTVTATFTVSLTAPAGPGGVTFDIATQDNTATTADNDYAANSLTGQTIPAGSSTYAFNVTVNGDTFVEPNQTFFVNVTSITGATAGDTQGQGTINNDDVTLTPIHDIQGPGASSPIVGASVTTRGVVTGVRTNGFFIQEPDATVDADPATSEGILVFVGAAPPAGAAVGNFVQVTGTVTEFVPTQDPFQPPLTELTVPTVVLVSTPPTAPPIPVAVALSATFPDPAGPHDQLERLEGMRVSVASLTVAGSTLGNVNEPNATATSTGVFHGVVTGVARPFREPGIQAPDPAPSGGSIPPIPRFDSNPERIRVDSDSIGAPVLDVGTGAVVTNLTGPMDYTFRTYSINPEPASPPSAAGGPTPSAVSVPAASEFTVAAYNLERFFDTVNDPGIGEPVLTAPAFNARLAKASLGIRDYLRTPDILGVVEVENLSTLQALAARISSDAVAASQPDPQYVAYLQEGNDVGGIDVGFLVKTSVVFGTTPRVDVISVTQVGLTSQFVNPDSSTENLNDRPSLVLEAEVNHPNGSVFPLTVIVNHLRSLNNSADPNPGSNGWATAGERVRAKRQEQAEELANYVQTLQTADPTRPIVLVGDFNAFEFNDGLGDSMGVIEGTPSPDNETAVPGDGVDLVNPDLVNLSTTAPATERYSFIFDGNAQSLDHIVVNDDLIANTTARREEHPRINADFPETARNGANELRLADHDPIVAFFAVEAFATAELSVTKTDSPDPVNAGTNLVYTITVTNAGPDPAGTVSLGDTLPAGTTFVSLSSPGGWSCTTPAVGAGGNVSCSIATLPVGSEVFTLTVNVGPAVAAGTVLSNTATASSATSDSNPGNESATATTTVATSADLSVTKADSPDPVTAGTNLTYTITVSNAGPSNAASVSLSDTVPAGTTFVSLTSPAGWSCTTPAVGAGGTASCSIAVLAPGSSEVFTLTVAVVPGTAAGTVLSNTATVSSATSDPNPGNESATATTTVAASADLSITKVDTPDPVTAGSNLTYTITVNNTGPSNLASVSLSDTLPAGTTFVSLSSPAGWSCTTPAVGAGGTVSCSIASMAPSSAVFTLTVQIGSSVADGTVLSNTATVSSATSDSNPGNESATATTTVSTEAFQASVTGTKTASGSFAPGGSVTYTVVLSNAGPGTQQDNPGDELLDVLPPELTLVSATATSGTAVATVGTNTVTWNGSIAAGASVTITINATIDSDVLPGTVIENQATLSYDNDGNGTNESTGVTDDPLAGGPTDPTGFTVTAQAILDIPTVDTVGLALLAVLLAFGGMVMLRRRRA